ncbi:aldehyde dehydrogenase (NADP(+)), partial [Xanthomonas oryzae pv. oryzae]
MLRCVRRCGCGIQCCILITFLVGRWRTVRRPCIPVTEGAAMNDTNHSSPTTTAEILLGGRWQRSGAATGSFRAAN